MKKKTAPKILLFLTQNKPASKWEIANILKLSYGNTHATIQQLLNRRLIKVEYKKPSTKNPKIEVEYYGLTLLGLFKVIHSFSEEELDNKIDMIAEKHADKLPLVFGKWEHFVKHGFREKAISNLKTIPTSSYFLRAQYASRSKFPQYYKAVISGTTHAFCFGELRIVHFFDIPPNEFMTISDLERQKIELERIESWLRMLMMDSDLKQYVKREFNFLIGFTSKYLDALKEIRSLAMKT